MHRHRGTFGTLFDWENAILLEHSTTPHHSGSETASHTYMVHRTIFRDRAPGLPHTDETPLALLYWLLHQMPKTRSKCLAKQEIQYEMERVRIGRKEREHVKKLRDSAKSDTNDPSGAGNDDGGGPGPSGGGGSLPAPGGGGPGSDDSGGPRPGSGPGGGGGARGVPPPVPPPPRGGGGGGGHTDSRSEGGSGPTDNDAVHSRRHVDGDQGSSRKDTPVADGAPDDQWSSPTESETILGSSLSRWTLLHPTDLVPTSDVDFSASPACIRQTTGGRTAPTDSHLHVLMLGRIRDYTVYRIILHRPPSPDLLVRRSVDVDTAASDISESPHSPVSFSPESIQVRLTSWVARGSTWDVYAATLCTQTSARTPDLNTTTPAAGAAAVVVKIFCPSTFRNFPRDDVLGVDRSRLWMPMPDEDDPGASDELDRQGEAAEKSVLTEAWLCQHVLSSFPHAPTCHGLYWLQDDVGNPTVRGGTDVYALVQDDCGDPPDDALIDEYG